MDVEEAKTFLADHHRAVLATSRSDGGPQLAPVLMAVDDEGFVVVSTRETAMKTKNVRRNPHVSAVVLSDNFFGEFVQLEGTATVVPLPEAMEGLVDYYRRISGEHPDWDDYRAAMQKERRVLLRIAVERAGPDRQG